MTDTAASAGPPPLAGWRRWLLPEVWRSAVASVLAIVTSLLLVAVVEGEPVSAQIAFRVVSVWCVLSVVHAALTFLAFHGLRGQALRHVLEDQGGTESRTGSSTRLDSGWSVSVSLLALVAVGALVLVPSLRESTPVLVVALAMVVASWADVAIVYAVRYTHLDARHGELRFPGDAVRTFGDYLYLAVAVQTTFGTTDVAVAGPTARRTVTRHTVIAYLFNTVIVAMVVSLLLGLS